MEKMHKKGMLNMEISKCYLKLEFAVELRDFEHFLRS